MPAGVAVVEADAARLPFAARSFSAVAAIAMLHHVPGVEAQQHLFVEARRVLRAGGLFVIVDVRSTLFLRLFHLGDTFVPVSGAEAPRRVRDAGFADATVRWHDPYFALVARTAV
jgi:ubiquinone/menaquinone biosynthesis C-methylase UbiE